LGISSIDVSAPFKSFVHQSVGFLLPDFSVLGSYEIIFLFRKCFQNARTTQKIDEERSYLLFSSQLLTNETKNTFKIGDATGQFESTPNE